MNEWLGTGILWALLLARTAEPRLQQTDKVHFPSVDFGNAVVKLIIKSYADSVMRELRSEAPLNASQERVLRERLGRLYEYVQRHPALRQRYLWVGRGHPTVNPDAPAAAGRQVWHRGGQRPTVHGPEPSRRGADRQEKRGDDLMLPLPLSEEICRTNTVWERMNKSVDSLGNAVEIVQDEAFPQWTFAYRCDSSGVSCVGIDALYTSECTERPGYVVMYHRKVGAEDEAPSWGAVEVPHHCTCKITPKIRPTI